MTNHPNRGWRSHWTVDLAAGTAEHDDGWLFVFERIKDGSGAMEGRCIEAPAPINEADVLHMAQAGRIAREAGEIFAETIRGSRRRGAGRPRSVGGRRIQLYLDDDSLQVAAQLGDGNISMGIRQALRQVHTTLGT